MEIQIQLVKSGFSTHINIDNCTKHMLISDHEIREFKILMVMRKICTRPWTSGDQTLAFQETGRQDPVRGNSKEKKQLRRAGRSLRTESTRTLFPGTQENEMYQETGLVSED